MTLVDLKAALENINVAAFLKCIRLGEGTSDELGYYRIVGGQMFTDDSRHPNVKVWIERYHVYSTAAGAYQIIMPTWRPLVRLYNFADFSPATQDLAAVALIEGRNALRDVIDGRFKEALKKCSEEWASLPYSKAGQRKELYAAVAKVYTDSGGVIA